MRDFKSPRLTAALAPLGATLGAALLCGAASAQGTSPTRSLVLDDFEDGVGKWTRNDKGKSQGAASVLLVDVLATQASEGGPSGSKSAGLFTFKAGAASWASASLRIKGADWAKIGARSLKFWLNADGQSPGVDLILRGTARNRDGSSRDVAYELPLDAATKRPMTIKLSTRRWREVAVPLTQFRDKDGGSVLSNLPGLYLLQFVQRGTWNSRFFTIDDVVLSGTGKPAAGATVASTESPNTEAGGGEDTTPSTSPAATPVAEDAIAVDIDFLSRPGRRLGRVRTAANISVGARSTGDGTIGRPFDDPAFVNAIKTLAPKIVRVEAGELVELLDSSRPSFDFSALQATVKAARSIGADPLVSLGAPATWGLDAAGYASYAAQAARALNLNTTRGPRSFELPVGGLEPSQAVAYYRAAYTALKTASKNYRVGGVGSTNAATLRTLLASAPGLDFLTIPFYGANAGQPELPVLFNATLSVPTLRSAAAALDASRFKLAPLYVTGAGLNAGRGDDGGPTDKRLGEMSASAWWSSFLLNGSRLADQVFYNDAANSDWGLLNPGGSAFPPYYALYLWNTFFPTGSERAAVKVTGGARGLQVLGVNTSTAHNALFVNTSSEPLNVRLTIRGFAVLRQARIRVLQEPLDPRQGITFTELPKSPFQNFALPPYSTAVLQFIEPPKAAPRAAPRTTPRATTRATPRPRTRAITRATPRG